VAPRVDGDDFTSVPSRARLGSTHAFVFYGLPRRRCVATMLCAAIACKSARRGGSQSRRVRPSRHCLPPCPDAVRSAAARQCGSVARSAARARARIRRRRRSRQLLVGRPVLSHTHTGTPQRLSTCAAQRSCSSLGATRCNAARSGSGLFAAVSRQAAALEAATRARLARAAVASSR
jgi:hypothetical protein